MEQKAPSSIEYANRCKKAGRDEFLETINEMNPWDGGTAFFNPYSFNGGCGCSPAGIDKMLIMYLLQIWFYL